MIQIKQDGRSFYIVGKRSIAFQSADLRTVADAAIQLAKEEHDQVKAHSSILNLIPCELQAEEQEKEIKLNSIYDRKPRLKYSR